MADILLIQPPIEDFYLTAKRTMPCGLASIAGSLRQAGFCVSILDALATTKARSIGRPEGMAHLEPFYAKPDRSPFALFHSFRHYGYSYEHIGRLARESGAFLVGISSLFSAYSRSAIETASVVKAMLPEACIVLGGHHPTALPEAVLDHPAVDFVIRGDGEIGFVALAKALMSKMDVEDIPGLAKRGPGNRLEISPPAIVEDLDTLPKPAFDLINRRFYSRFGKPCVSICATRGCPLHCTYCAVNASTHHGFRRRSVAAVMEELKSFSRSTPIGFIDFEDEHLTTDRRWFVDLLRALRTAFPGEMPELRAMNGLFAPSLDDELVGLMADSGFRELNLALITTSREQLKRFRRPDVRAAVDRVLARAARLPLSAVVYIIIAGPGQQPAASLDDLLYLAGRRALAGVSVFYPAPGSSDYQWCGRNGLLPSRFGLMRATALPLEHRTGRLQTVTLLRLGRILNYMKHLLDSGRKLPPASHPSNPFLPETVDRDEAGRMLLSAFLADGRIRGIDDGGRIFEHLIDTQLSEAFLGGLGRTGVRGARSNCFARL